MKTKNRPAERLVQTPPLPARLSAFIADYGRFAGKTIAELAECFHMQVREAISANAKRFTKQSEWAVITNSLRDATDGLPPSMSDPAAFLADMIAGVDPTGLPIARRVAGLSYTEAWALIWIVRYYAKNESTIDASSEWWKGGGV